MPVQRPRVDVLPCDKEAEAPPIQSPSKSEESGDVVPGVATLQLERKRAELGSRVHAEVRFINTSPSAYDVYDPFLTLKRFTAWPAGRLESPRTRKRAIR